MEPKPIYFDKEAPEFNYGLYGRPERLAANRVMICIMTEFGLCNDRRMQSHQVNRLLELLQTTTGSFGELKTRIKPKSSYIRKRSLTKPIKTIGPATLCEHTCEGSPIESTSQ